MKPTNDPTIEGKIVELDKEKGIGIISLAEHKIGQEDKNTIFFNKEHLALDTTITDLTIGMKVRLHAAIDESGPHASEVTKVIGASSSDLEKIVDPNAACVERLSSSKPAVEKVVEDAIIEEDRIIEKNEALNYLVLAAVSDKIDLDSLNLTEVFTDKNGAIIKIEAKSVDEKTGNFKLLTYQIKRAESVDETNVDVSSWNKDEDWPNSGDVLAKYVGGKWSLFDNTKPKGEKWVAQE
jgi:hypothetical protein